MKKLLSFFPPFSTRLSRPSAPNAGLQRLLVIGLNIFLAGAALVSIAIRAQFLDQNAPGSAPGSESVGDESKPPIHWDPMLNPVEYAEAEAPYKNEDELRTEEFAAFTISDPEGFSEQMLKHKTKEHIDREESAMFAVKNPETHRKQVDAQKNEEQREADQDSALAIKNPDIYKRQRAKKKDSEEKRLEALAAEDILDPERYEASRRGPERKPKPSRN